MVFYTYKNEYRPDLSIFFSTKTTTEFFSYLYYHLSAFLEEKNIWIVTYGELDLNKIEFKFLSQLSIFILQIENHLFLFAIIIYRGILKYSNSNNYLLLEIFSYLT